MTGEYVNVEDIYTLENCNFENHVLFAVRTHISLFVSKIRFKIAFSQEKIVGKVVYLFVPAYLVNIVIGAIITIQIRVLSKLNSTKWIKLNRNVLLVSTVSFDSIFQCLTFQAAVPFIGVIYVILLVFWSNIDSLNAASLAFMMFGLIPILNGAVTVLFIPPYRRFVLGFMAKNKRKVTPMQNTRTLGNREVS